MLYHVQINIESVIFLQNNLWPSFTQTIEVGPSCHKAEYVSFPGSRGKEAR